MATEIVLDVWFKFDNEKDVEDFQPALEANTLKVGPEKFVVEWSHTAVGQVSRGTFDTYEAATNWLAEQGFRDFSS